ncbi:MAG: M20/M25/M40 family metallo-hydrolase [Methanobrevibacter sp.]|jgi:tripeptide aminopeptidase|nr:M20/M25/M40 family metallo-hydrolase [Methanobrevibacter sp.]
MNTERLLQTFQELVSIDNPSLFEREICDYISLYLNNLGFTVYEDDVASKIMGNSGNLYCFLEGDESLEPLLFSAHMDVIEPSYGKQAIIHENGNITSDGTTILGADDLAGVSVILEAVTTIKENNFQHRPIELVFFVGEEIYGIGSKVFDYSLLKSKEAYILDSSGEVGSAAYKAPTLISFDVTVLGKSGHTGFHSNKIIHSIAITSEAITKIKMGQIDEESTCNMGVIQGGLAPNIIPYSCKVKGEIRSHSHKKAIEILNEISNIFHSTGEKYNAVVNFESKVQIKAYETPLNHPVVERFKNVCGDLNINPAFYPTFGGSDNNNLEEHEINGLVLANAMHNPHSCEETSSISELEKITNIVIALMRNKD